MANKPEIIIISGEIGQGKTTFLQNLTNELKKINLDIAGILSLGNDVRGIREGYNLLNIRTGESRKLCSTSYNENHLPFGRFYFDSEAFRIGNNWLEESAGQCPDLMIIDEIGPLELLGNGWSRSIDYLLKNSITMQTWVVRKQLVEKVLSKWEVINSRVFDIGSVNLDSVLKIIKRIITGCDKFNYPVDF